MNIFKKFVFANTYLIKKWKMAVYEVQLSNVKHCKEPLDIGRLCNALHCSQQILQKVRE